MTLEQKVRDLGERMVERFCDLGGEPGDDCGPFIVSRDGREGVGYEWGERSVEVFPPSSGEWRGVIYHGGVEVASVLFQGVTWGNVSAAGFLSALQEAVGER